MSLKSKSCPHLVLIYIDNILCDENNMVDEIYIKQEEWKNENKSKLLSLIIFI